MNFMDMLGVTKFQQILRRVEYVDQRERERECVNEFHGHVRCDKISTNIKEG